MDVVLVFFAVLAVMFVVSFITKRRFGVLGLALAAGATLSNLWAAVLTPLFVEFGIETTIPPLPSLVAALLVLTPAVALLFSGPTYDSMLSRVIGSAMFAALAFAFLLEPLEGTLVLQGLGRQVYEFFIEYRVWLVTAGLIFAIFDLLATKNRRLRRGKH